MAPPVLLFAADTDPQCAGHDVLGPGRTRSTA